MRAIPCLVFHTRLGCSTTELTQMGLRHVSEAVLLNNLWRCGHRLLRRRPDHGRLHNRGLHNLVGVLVGFHFGVRGTQ